jgi:hypothetical protein
MTRTDRMSTAATAVANPYKFVANRDVDPPIRAPESSPKPTSFRPFLAAAGENGTASPL